MKKKLFSKLAATALAAAMVIGTATTSLSTYAAGLNQVTGLSVVERDEDELTLKWKKVAGADGYLLYRYNTSAKKWQKIKTTSKTRYEVEHLKAGTKYHFTVRAYDKTKSGVTYYGPYAATLTTYTAPDEVDNLSVTKTTQTSVSLKWSKAKGASKYQVYLYDSAARKYVRKATVSGTSATISGLKSGVTYKFKVRAYKAVGNTKYYGDFSDSRKAKTTGKSTTASTSKGYIGAAKAKSIALKHAALSASKVRGLKAKLDKEHGIMVYEVEFHYGHYEYDYEINAKTGAIIDYEKEWDD